MDRTQFAPCSRKHRQCSPAHAALVADYRLERHRQEVAFEGATGGHATDEAFLKAKGANLINFRTWLTAHSRRGQR